MAVMIKEQIFQLKLQTYELAQKQTTTHKDALANAMELYLWVIQETDEYKKLEASLSTIA